MIFGCVENLDLNWRSGSGVEGSYFGPPQVLEEIVPWS